jgi:hypothetical protein
VRQQRESGENDRKGFRILQKGFVYEKKILILHFIFKHKKMIRTVFKSYSNLISVPIPDRYIGTELEVLVFPISEVLTSKAEMKTPEVDMSFGGWVDMDKTTEEICSEIRAGRTFRNRDFVL